MLLSFFIVDLNILNWSKSWGLNHIWRRIFSGLFFLSSLSTLCLLVFFRHLFIIFINGVRDVSVELGDNFGQNFEGRLCNVLFIWLYQNGICNEETVSGRSRIEISHRKSYIKYHAGLDDSVIFSLDRQLFFLFIETYTIAEDLRKMLQVIFFSFSLDKGHNMIVHLWDLSTGLKELDKLLHYFGQELICLLLFIHWIDKHCATHITC